MTSRRDQDRENDSLSELMDIFWKAIRNRFHTGMPGHIIEYDPATRRATVQPALSIVFTGERPTRRPPILNVPVAHYAGHGMILHTPLESGDPVWLSFSERGLGAWKRNILGEAVPDRGHYFDIGDAIAYPVFDDPQGDPVITDGFSLQTADGDTYLTIKDGAVHVKGMSVTIEDGDITINGTGAITINGGTVTITGATTVNAGTIADAGAGTQSGGAPPHTHDLTAL